MDCRGLGSCVAEGHALASLHIQAVACRDANCWVVALTERRCRKLWPGGGIERVDVGTMAIRATIGMRQDLRYCRQAPPVSNFPSTGREPGAPRWSSSCPAAALPCLLPQNQRCAATRTRRSVTLKNVGCAPSLQIAHLHEHVQGARWLPDSVRRP